MRWKTNSCSGRGGDVGNDLYGGGAGADDADALVGQAVRGRRSSRLRCTRSPTGWCGRRDPRMSRCPGCPGAWAGAAGRCPSRGTGPTSGRPDWCGSSSGERSASHVDGGDLGGEAGALVQAEVPGDALAVLEDLRGAGVLLAGDVGRLLQAAGGRRRTRRRTARPGYLFQYQVPPKSPPFSMMRKSSMPACGEPGAGDQAGEPTADDGDGDVVDQRGRGRPGPCRDRAGSPRTARPPRRTGRSRPAGSACRVRAGISRGARPGRSPATSSVACRRCSRPGGPCGRRVICIDLSSASATQRSPAVAAGAVDRRG